MRQNSRETLKASLCCFFEAAEESYSLLCAHLWYRRCNKNTLCLRAAPITTKVSCFAINY